MAKIVTLGEIMLRLSPNGNDRFIQSDLFRIIPGGGEANVAVSVANYGHEAYFVNCQSMKSVKLLSTLSVVMALIPTS